jgi:hypothetical protein
MEPLNLNPACQFQIREQPTHYQFTCFLRLPLEIRQEIWHYALASKEVSVITLTQADVSHLEDEESRCFLVTTHLVKASYKICPLAHVCHESRVICLSRYQLCFEGPLQHPILFDPRTDLLLMSDLHALSSFLGLPWDSFSRSHTEGIDMILYLAICGDWQGFTDLLMPRLYQFHNLEHVILEQPKNVFMIRSSASLAYVNEQRGAFEPVPPHWPHFEGPIISHLRDHQMGLARKMSMKFKVPKVEVVPRHVFDGTGIRD